jgi:hypothetical protein
VECGVPRGQLEAVASPQHDLRRLAARRALALSAVLLTQEPTFHRAGECLK